MMGNVLHIFGRDGHLSGHGPYRAQHTSSIDECQVSIERGSHISIESECD